MQGVSIIVCCYNSVDRIADTLMHLKQQEVLGSLQWEVVLVDNNSTDKTVEVAMTVWNNFDVPLCIVKEQKPGLSHARNAGIAAARYDYIIFCDDDNWLSKNYIQTVFSVLENDKTIGAVGGQGILALPEGVTAPQWFYQCKESYALGRQADRSKDVTREKMYLWGAGIGLRKEAFLRAFSKEFPSLMLGRKGEQLSAGDDAELCMRLIIMGYTLYYDETLEYKHFITANRLTTAYFQKMQKGFENTFGIQTMYSELIHYFIFSRISANAIFKKFVTDLFQNKDFRITSFRRFVFWKWGIPVVRNQQQEMLRKFYLANASIKGN